MSELLDIVIGPLVGPECRRALGRGWVLWVRFGAAIPACVVTLFVLWLMWVSLEFDPSFRPALAIAITLGVLEGMALTVALVLSPALVAGTLAGEKAQGVLPLLLAANVSSREIVSARLAGRMCIVASVLAAAVPASCLFAGLASMPLAGVLLLLVAPLAVAFGCGGLALAASSVARRGRDALLAGYLIELALVLIPSFVGPFFGGFGAAAAVAMNPYFAIGEMFLGGEPWELLFPMAAWSGVGLVCTAFAAWRLRRSALGLQGAPSRRTKRRTRVPEPSDERPMLWKELHIERLGTFNRFVRLLGWVIALVLVGGSVALLAMLGYFHWNGDGPQYRQTLTLLESWVTMTMTPVGCLIQWAMGLRAAVAVAAERERGTWDGILLSLLEGREIVNAKIWGSAYAMRAFLVAVVATWTLTVFVGALAPLVFVGWLARTLVISLFMTAVGVAFSLYSETATRAMTLTIVVWLGAGAAFYMLDGVLWAVCALVWFVAMMAWAALTGELLTGRFMSRGPGPISVLLGDLAFPVLRLGLYVVATVLVAGYCRISFDRLAGRLLKRNVVVRMPVAKMVAPPAAVHEPTASNEAPPSDPPASTGSDAT